jgi:hypothetical protein
VLHLFHIGIDNEGALRDKRPGDFGGGGQPPRPTARIVTTTQPKMT